MVPLCLLLGAAGPAQQVRVVDVNFTEAGMPMTLSGWVQARTLAELAFRVGGQVVDRPVEIGDHVRAGQVLARLDPADLRLSQQTAEAALAAAQADAANTQIDLQRYVSLGRTSPAYLPSEFDRRVAAAHMAAARLIQAVRQAQIARDQSQYGSLLADADGIITALPVQVGQVVTPGQTVASLAHTGDTEVVVDVPENRLAAVKAAGTVTIALWAVPDVILHGRVREIGALADPATRTFAVKYTVLDAPPGLLALGMTATVRFEPNGAKVALLPASALTDKDGSPAVWVLVHGHAALRLVTLSGYTDDSRMVVSSGVEPGDRVITAGVGQINPLMDLVAWAGASR